jgi:hypothetical protein
MPVSPFSSRLITSIILIERLFHLDFRKMHAQRRKESCDRCRSPDRTLPFVRFSLNVNFSMRPTSRNAYASPFCRGYAANFPKMSDAVTVPLRIELVRRCRSSQWASICFTLIIPPRCPSFQSWIDVCFLNAIHALLPKLGNPWSKAKTQEMRQTKNLIRTYVDTPVTALILLYGL